MCAEESLIALQKAFPAGKRDGLSYVLNNDFESFNYTVYNKVKGIEVGILDACLGMDTLLSLEANSNNALISRFILESSITHNDNGVIVGEGFDKSATLYNTYSKQSFLLKKNERIRWMAVYFPIEEWINFNGSRWPELNEQLSSQEPWIIFESLTPEMTKVLKDAFEIQNRKEGRTSLTIAKGIELLALFFIQINRRSRQLENIGIPDVELKLMFKLKKELVQDLANTPDLKELSAQFNINETKLRANFKKVFGMPPYQFVLQEKLNEAHRLLTNTDRSITDIALSLGFTDNSHFTRRFKKAFNYLPKDVK